MPRAVVPSVVLAPRAGTAQSRACGPSADHFPDAGKTVILTRLYFYTPEALALQADARNVWGKLEAVAVRVHVLETDREKIQDCMNAINSEYTRIIFFSAASAPARAPFAGRSGRHQPARRLSAAPGPLSGPRRF